MVMPPIFIVHKYMGLTPDGQPNLRAVAIAPTLEGAEQFCKDNKIAAYSIAVSVNVRCVGIPQPGPVLAGMKTN